MGYDKYGVKYYLDNKDKKYITNKIDNYIKIIEPKKNKSREWFKLSKFWYNKANNTDDDRYKLIYTTIARCCYALYSNNKPSNKDNKPKRLIMQDFI